MRICYSGNQVIVHNNISGSGKRSCQLLTIPISVTNSSLALHPQAVRPQVLKTSKAREPICLHPNKSSTRQQSFHICGFKMPLYQLFLLKESIQVGIYIWRIRQEIKHTTEEKRELNETISEIYLIYFIYRERLLLEFYSTKCSNYV